MAYILDSISMKTDNSPQAMEQTAELWKDIVSGKVPLLYDSDGKFREGLSPVTAFENVSLTSAEPYTMTILTVPPSFFAELNAGVSSGTYRLYEGTDAADLGKSTDIAWEAVQKDIAAGRLDSTVTGYESTVPPEYAPDRQAHCCVYIAVPAA